MSFVFDETNFLLVRCEILLVIISESAFDSHAFVFVIEYVLQQKHKLILVHDDLCRFPAEESLPQ